MTVVSRLLDVLSSVLLLWFDSTFVLYQCIYICRTGDATMERREYVSMNFLNHISSSFFPFSFYSLALPQKHNEQFSQSQTGVRNRMWFPLFGKHSASHAWSFWLNTVSSSVLSHLCHALLRIQK